jgi:hypothetical protein
LASAAVAPSRGPESGAEWDSPATVAGRAVKGGDDSRGANDGAGARCGRAGWAGCAGRPVGEAAEWPLPVVGGESAPSGCDDGRNGGVAGLADAGCDRRGVALDLAAGLDRGGGLALCGIRPAAGAEVLLPSGGCLAELTA